MTNPEHSHKVKGIVGQIKFWKESGNNKTKKIRFNHGSTNSTKPRPDDKYFYIDISSLNRVISIDPEQKTALVEPNVPMDKLVAETLRHGLIPQVVMEFPGITVGGAIQGAALESSSFKFGQFNQSAIEYEVITATGEIISASNEQNKDLFYGMSGSYGTLGLLTLIKIKLVPATKFVQVDYLSVNSFRQAIESIKNQPKEVDYIDGIMFNANKGVIVVGRKVENGRDSIQTFSKATDPWFYKHAEEMIGQSELVPIVDYLFRYNRGSFWTGEFFFNLMKIPGGNSKFNRIVFNPFLNTRKLYEVLHSMNWMQRFFIQDIYFPLETTEEALNYLNKQLNIYPVWLCPIKNTTNAEKMSPNYISSDLLIDIGIWGLPPENSDYIQINKDAEEMIEKLGGRKMFYAQSFYSKDQFWRIYDYQWYKDLRQKYQADDVFPDIYEKVHMVGKTKATVFRGFWKLLWSFLTLKNLNS